MGRGAMTTKNWAIAAALCLALGACGKHKPASTDTSAATKAEARAVAVTRVELRAIAGGVSASGVLLPREDVAVSPDLAGYRVVKVLVDEGSWVKAGQPLVELDTSLLKAQVDQQVALAAQQRSLADRSDAEAARVQGLDASGVLSQEQLDARRFAARSAHASANAADASAREMQTRLAHLNVRAPVSGLVIERTVRAGDISAGGATPWFRIAQDGQVELSADVAEADFAQLRLGMGARVTLPDQTTVNGTVRLISPRVDANTKLGKARISLPVSPNIRAGGFGKADFIDTTRPVASVPETAVRYDADGASVMVVGADNRVSLVPVKTGQRGGGFVELLSGVGPGAVVVAKAAAQLLPGDYVKPDWGKAPAR